ncbi:MAG: hypothetical protein GC154_02060 [bacterium]|nr:hypothetical protein [bacterium]
MIISILIAAGFIATVLRPREMLTALLACSVIAGIRLHFTGVESSISWIAALMTIPGFLTRYSFASHKNDPPHIIALFTLLAACLLASLSSLNSAETAFAMARMLLSIFTALVFLYECGRTESSFMLKRDIQGIMALSVAIAFVQSFLQPAGNFHLSGGFSDSNYFPVMLASLLPLLIARSIHERSRPLAILSAAGFLAALGSFSNSGWLVLALSLSLFVCLTLWKSNPRRFGVLLFIAPMAVFIVFIAILTAFHARLLSVLASPRLHERILNLQLYLTEFFTHPVLGVGAGQYAAMAQPFAPDAPLSREYSTVLLMFTESGVFGGIALIVFLTLTLRGFLDQSRNDMDELKRAALLTSASALIVGMLISNAGDFLFTWCWLGWLAAQSAQPDELNADFTASLESEPARSV